MRCPECLSKEYDGLICDVEKTIKNALDNGYNAHIVINGETYLIKEGDLNE